MSAERILSLATELNKAEIDLFHDEAAILEKQREILRNELDHVERRLAELMFF